jgi:hypothetical protein
MSIGGIRKPGRDSILLYIVKSNWRIDGRINVTW